MGDKPWPQQIKLGQTEASAKNAENKALLYIVHRIFAGTSNDADLAEETALLAICMAH